MTMVKIVGIGGSLRENSSSQQALKLALKRVEALGAEVAILYPAFPKAMTAFCPPKPKLKQRADLPCQD